MGSAIDKAALGECRSVSITCLSEIGWHDTAVMQADVTGSNGPGASQWDKTWHADNAAGSASLVEVEALDGRRHTILVDCGWDEAYMRRRFEDTGVAQRLRRGEIDLLFLSHEHLDHLWGIQAVLRQQPALTIRVPATFSETALAVIRGERAVPTRSDPAPLVRHTGRIELTPPGVPQPLFPGCVAVTFDVPIMLGIRGEQSLYFRVRERGTVCVTGCCHQTVTALADYALREIADQPTLYGLYGGLHIAPFGPLTPPQEQMIADLARFGFRKIAANHCTGLPALERMVDLGYPVVGAAGHTGAPPALALGTGAQVTF